VWGVLGEGENCFAHGRPGMGPVCEMVVLVVGYVVLETEPAVSSAGHDWCVGVVLKGLGDRCFVLVGETGVRDVHVFRQIKHGDFTGKGTVW
jgi:hypothetical protein